MLILSAAKPPAVAGRSSCGTKTDVPSRDIECTTVAVSPFQPQAISGSNEFHDHLSVLCWDSWQPITSRIGFGSAHKQVQSSMGCVKYSCFNCRSGTLPELAYANDAYFRTTRSSRKFDCSSAPSGCKDKLCTIAISTPQFSGTIFLTPPRLSSSNPSSC